MPEDILSYVEADYGISGPGEGAMPALLDMLGRSEEPARLLQGWDYSFQKDMIYRRGTDIDYRRYLDNGGLAGFETQKGCPAACVYCVEAKTRHQVRDPLRIRDEIGALAAQGFSDFHLCDCEFNIELPGCIYFLKKLQSAGFSIRWSLYIKPEPVSEEMFSLLRETGADVVTLTVNSYEFKRSGYSEKVAFCIDCANNEGITLAIDLLTGFPFESVDTMYEVIDFFHTHRSVSVGVNYHIRIYPGTALYSYFNRHKNLKPHLIMPYGGSGDFIKPVFYRHPLSEDMVHRIADDPLFRVEGIEPGTNYQRFQKSKDRQTKV